jgi:hypothetical protein
VRQVVFFFHLLDQGGLDRASEASVDLMLAVSAASDFVAAGTMSVTSAT